MKSFIPWIGGKSLLAKKITAEFPKDFGRYIEVFGGGASVLFSADRHAKFEVYNDANGDLVNQFRCLKYHREELQKALWDNSAFFVYFRIYFSRMVQIDYCLLIFLTCTLFYYISTSFQIQENFFITRPN
ncbi:MAG: DNA adenine methylase [Oscillospiraceae bacterium]|nr:DNA adenine methylase [Oscillospiraceae bacterium]